MTFFSGWKRCFALGALALSVFTGGAHAVVITRTVDNSESTGSPTSMGPHTTVQYLSFTRVWFSPFEILVCPPDTATAKNVGGNPPNKFCWPGSGPEPTTAAAREEGWIPMSQYTRGGLQLRAAQVNQTPYGLTLVLFWDPTPEVLKADKLKHPSAKAP